MEVIDLSEFVKKASAGVLSHFESDVKRQKARLDEFMTKQTQLLHTVDDELARYNALESLQLEEMMTVLKTCQIRLQAIKERMRKASTKVAKLKKRSLRLQQMKQKEALDRELRREAQLTREQEMVVKTPSV